MEVLKSFVKRHPTLRRWLSQARAINWHLMNLQFSAGKYTSKFGGFWTDRQDYQDVKKAKLNSKEVQVNELSLLDFWHKNGYVILAGAVSHSDINAFVSELDDLPKRAPPGLLITGGKEVVARPYDPTSVRAHESIRIIDFYFHSENCRRLLFNQAIVRFLQMVFETQPVLNQSLSFEYGSEQAIHQDTAFVAMNSPKGLAACWIALEDIKEGSGELIYYPGSHHWKDFLFSGFSKHFSADRDGGQQLADFHQGLHDEAKRRGVQMEKFKAKKGDVLIWHADLAHGGAPIVDSSLTRRSLVGHYCPKGVRPMYYYWHPKYRKMYSKDGNLFMTGNYL